MKTQRDRVKRPVNPRKKTIPLSNTDRGRRSPYPMVEKVIMVK
jgi:hypothetical protein